MYKYIFNDLTLYNKKVSGNKSSQITAINICLVSDKLLDIGSFITIKTLFSKIKLTVFAKMFTSKKKKIEHNHTNQVNEPESISRNTNL